MNNVITTHFKRDTNEYVVTVGEDVFVFDSYIAYKGFQEALLWNIRGQVRGKPN